MAHAAAKERVDRVVAGTDEIIVPALFQVEVAFASTRAGVGAATVLPYAKQLMARTTLVTSGPKRAASIQAVAMKTRLCATDAAYVWLAGRENGALLTSDTEVLTRAAPVCIADEERPAHYAEAAWGREDETGELLAKKRARASVEVTRVAAGGETCGQFFEHGNAARSVRLPK